MAASSIIASPFVSAFSRSLTRIFLSLRLPAPDLVGQNDRAIAEKPWARAGENTLHPGILSIGLYRCNSK